MQVIVNWKLEIPKAFWWMVVVKIWGFASHYMSLFWLFPDGMAIPKRDKSSDLRTNKWHIHDHRSQSVRKDLTQESGFGHLFEVFLMSVSSTMSNLSTHLQARAQGLTFEAEPTMSPPQGYEYSCHSSSNAPIEARRRLRQHHGFCRVIGG